MGAQYTARQIRADAVAAAGLKVQAGRGLRDMLVLVDGAQLQAILDLDVEERLQIVQLIWDSIAEDPEAMPLTAADRAEIDQRIAEDDANPEDVVTWQAAKDRILRAR